MSRHLVPILAFFLIAGCSSKPAPDLEPLPPIEFSQSEITPFLTQDVWKSTPYDWNIVNDALKYEIQMPDALETRLTKEDRLLWRSSAKTR